MHLIIKTTYKVTVMNNILKVSFVYDTYMLLTDTSRLPLSLMLKCLFLSYFPAFMIKKLNYEKKKM